MTISAAAPTTPLPQAAIAMQAEAAAAQAEAIAAAQAGQATGLASPLGTATAPGTAVPGSAATAPAAPPKKGLLSSLFGLFGSRARVLSMDLLQAHAAAVDAITGADPDATVPSAAAQAAAGAAARAPAPLTATSTSLVPAATTPSATPVAAAPAAPATSVTGGITAQAVHIAQFRGPYLPDGPEMRPNCGPAAVTMALRLIGRDIPGFSGQKSAAVLDKARVIGTGRNDTSVGTTDSELERVVEASGAKWSESSNLPQITQWVKQGIPVVLAGNPSQAWDRRFRPSDVHPFDGGHWVTVSGFNSATGNYVVNDPLSQIGAIEVSEGELQAYFSRNGGLGIAVFN